MALSDGIVGLRRGAGRLALLLGLTLGLAAPLGGGGLAAGESPARAALNAGDFIKAFVLFKPRAEAGDTDAMFQLGRLHQLGMGAPKDQVRAVHWFRQAAERGHLEAQYWLGYSYQRGRGVELDMIEAHRWFHLGADAGDKPAKFDHDLTAKAMSEEELDEAHRRARLWWEAHVTATETSPLWPASDMGGP